MTSNIGIRILTGTQIKDSTSDDVDVYVSKKFYDAKLHDSFEITLNKVKSMPGLKTATQVQNVQARGTAGSVQASWDAATITGAIEDEHAPDADGTITFNNIKIKEHSAIEYIAERINDSATERLGIIQDTTFTDDTINKVGNYQYKITA